MTRSDEAVARGPVMLVVLLVAARFLLPLVLIDSAWEFHRDALLYFAMGDHLDFFRMQFPPFIAVLARASRTIFGDSVLAARVPAALGGAGLLLVMLLLARRLGGRTWSLALIAVASLCAPVFVRPSVLFQPVVFDQLWCTTAVAGIVLAAREEQPRWWLVAGFGLGMGLMTKFAAAFYAACLALTALAVPRLRRQLATRWPWIAAALALLLALPSLTGQMANGWPFFAQMETLRASQLERVTDAQFLVEQPLMLGTAALLVLLGVAAAVRGGPAERTTFLFGLLLVLVMLFLNGKPYYAAPAYPALIVTGACALERWTRSSRRLLAWGVALAMVAGGAVLLPIGIPIFGPEAMARYAGRLGVTAAVRTNRGEVLPLPQDYADMLGWRDKAEAVAEVWNSLDPSDQARAVIGASNYGQTGALAMYSRRFGYPYPVSTAGDFHAWGPGENSGEVGIVLAPPSGEDDLAELWREVTPVRRLLEPRGVPEEQDLRIFLVRGLRRPLGEVWPSLGPEWG